MSENSLASIEWHDLPASEIHITETGISLVITPYNKAVASYGRRVLRITEAESISLKIAGTLSPQDLASIEVSTFTYSVEPSGRITGTLGLLPGQAGFWEVLFTNARWELADV